MSKERHSYVTIELHPMQQSFQASEPEVIIKHSTLVGIYLKQTKKI